MAKRQVLAGAILIDGTGTDPVEDGILAFEDGIIVYAGTKAAYSAVEDEVVIDVSGRTIIPGIIDCHCHLGGTSFPDEDNWVLEPDIYKTIASVHQANAMLQHGITSVRDISVHGTHLRKAINDGLITGPRIVPCWRGLSRRGGHGDAAGVPPELVRASHPWGIVADGVEECRKITREIVKQGSHCIKIWASGGGLHENEPEDAQHYSYDELVSGSTGLARVVTTATRTSPAAATCPPTRTACGSFSVAGCPRTSWQPRMQESASAWEAIPSVRALHLLGSSRSTRFAVSSRRA
jgi:imidazolonepropionase-like amidohydrolase